MKVQQLIKSGMAVEIHWALKHVGVEENEKTYDVGKESMERAGTRRCSEEFALLALIQRAIIERR